MAFGGPSVGRRDHGGGAEANHFTDRPGHRSLIRQHVPATSLH